MKAINSKINVSSVFSKVKPMLGMIGWGLAWLSLGMMEARAGGVNVVWGQYFGGSSSEEVKSVHSDGRVIAIGGWTYSWNEVASAGAWQGNARGGKEGFVAVFDGEGRRLWSSFIGGSGEDEVVAVKVEGGSVYVGGTSSRVDFVENFRGGMRDGFVVKFDAQTGRRQWAVGVGGAGEDEIVAMDVSGGEVYVAGSSSTPGLVTAGAGYQAVKSGWSMAGFVQQVRVDGSLGRATYYGAAGVGTTRVEAVKVDGGGVIVAGTTTSREGIGAVGERYPAMEGASVGFVGALSRDLRVRQWGRYFGNGGHWRVHGVDSDGVRVYVAGRTQLREGLTGFRAVGEQRGYGGGMSDGFLAALERGSGAGQWWTYVGGAGQDEVRGVRVSGGRVCVVGGSDMGGVAGVVKSGGGGMDGMVMVFGAGDGRLEWGGYAGGNSWDLLSGVAEFGGDWVVVGVTNSVSGIASGVGNGRGLMGWSDGWVARLARGKIGGQGMATLAGNLGGDGIPRTTSITGTASNQRTAPCFNRTRPLVIPGQADSQFNTVFLSQHLDLKCGPATWWMRLDPFPEGLDLRENTGEVYGLPRKAGEKQARVIAGNGYGESESLTLEFKITGEYEPCIRQSSISWPIVLNESLKEINLNDYVDNSSERCGRPTRWEEANKLGEPNEIGLPDGLTMNSQTGLIFGIPRTIPAGPVKLYAVNNRGKKPISILFTSLCIREDVKELIGYVGESMRYDLNDLLLKRQGCYGLARWSVVRAGSQGGALPESLRIDNESLSHIVGTPRAVGKADVLIEGRAGLVGAESVGRKLLSLIIRDRKPCFNKTDEVIRVKAGESFNISLQRYLHELCDTPLSGYWSFDPNDRRVDSSRRRIRIDEQNQISINERGEVSGFLTRDLTARVYAGNYEGGNYLEMRFVVSRDERPPCLDLAQRENVKGFIGRDIEPVDLNRYLVNNSSCGSANRWRLLSHNGVMPRGLTLDAGIIRGMPEVTFNDVLIISAGNSAGDVLLYVNCVIQPRSCLTRNSLSITGKVSETLQVNLNPLWQLNQGGCGMATQWRVVRSSLPHNQLPKGIKLDERFIGWITGTVAEPGNATVYIEVGNSSAREEIKLEFEFTQSERRPCFKVKSRSYDFVRKVKIEDIDLNQFLDNSCARPSIWHERNGKLPSGLTLNPSTGQITGTPDIAQVSEVEIHAVNGVGHDHIRLRFNVTEGAPCIDKTRPIIISNEIATKPETINLNDYLIKKDGCGNVDYWKLESISTQYPDGTIETGKFPRGFYFNNGLIEFRPEHEYTGEAVISANNSAGKDTIVVKYEFYKIEKPQFKNTANLPPEFGRINQYMEIDLAKYLVNKPGTNTKEKLVWNIIPRQGNFIYTLPAGLELDPEGYIKGIPIKRTDQPHEIMVNASNSKGLATMILRIDIPGNLCVDREIFYDEDINPNIPINLSNRFTINDQCGYPTSFEVTQVESPIAGIQIDSRGIVQGRPRFSEGVNELIGKYRVRARNSTDSVDFRVTFRVKRSAKPCSKAIAVAYQLIFGKAINPINLNQLLEQNSSGQCAPATAWVVLNRINDDLPGGNRDNLPRGLRLDPLRGVIEGTPLEETLDGNREVTILATNSEGTVEISVIIEVKKQYHPSVNFPLPDNTVPTTLPLYRGKSYYINLFDRFFSNDYVTRCNCRPDAITRLDSLSLPSDLSFNNGVISGVPKVVGAYTYTFVAVNRAGSRPFEVTLDVRPSKPCFTNGRNSLDYIINYRKGVPINQELVLTADKNCPTPAAWYEDPNPNMKLPRGLRLTQSTGQVEGVIDYNTEIPDGYKAVLYAAGLDGYATLNLIFYEINDSTSGRVAGGSDSGNKTTQEVYTHLAPCFTQETIRWPIFLERKLRDLDLNNYLNQNACGRPTRWVEAASEDRSQNHEFLPKGLYLDSTRGVIYGVPTALPKGPVRILGINPGGRRGVSVEFYVDDSYGLCLARAISPENIREGEEYILNLRNLFTAKDGCIMPIRLEEDPDSPLPSGLKLDPNTWEIRGIPAASAVGSRVSKFRVRYARENREMSITFNVQPKNLTKPCYLINPDPIAGRVGQSINVDLNRYVRVGCDRPNNWWGSGFPSWLSIDSSTGMMSGIPSGTGSWNLQIYGSNRSGGEWLTLRLNVERGDLKPCFTRRVIDDLEPARVQEYFKVDLNSYIQRGCGKPTNWVVVNNVRIPDDLNLNHSTGILDGIPRIAGEQRIRIRAWNNSGAEEVDVVVNVLERPVRKPCFIQRTDTIRDLKTWHKIPEKDRDLNRYLNQNNPICGQPTRWEVVGERISWLTLDEQTGRISGIPDRVGDQTVRIRASNSQGFDDLFLTFSVSLAGPKPCFQQQYKDLGEILAWQDLGGIDLKQFLNRNDFCGEPRLWNVKGQAGNQGGLPLNLSLDVGTGVISGTPTQVGIYTATVVASNTFGEDVMVLRLNVVGRKPCANRLQNEVPGTRLQPMTVNLNSYLQRNQQCGQPTQWQVVNGSFPSGLQPRFPDLRDGILLGTPNNVGSQTVELLAINPAGSERLLFTFNIVSGEKKPCFAEKQKTLYGVKKRGFTENLNRYLSQGRDCGQPVSWKIISGDKPPGINLDERTGWLTGIPDAVGNFDLTIEASNESGKDEIILRISIDLQGPPCFIKQSETIPGVEKQPIQEINLKNYLVEENGICGVPDRWYILPSPDNLPAGLTLDPFNATIKGIPDQSGVTTVNVYASNSKGSRMIALTFNILPNISAPCFSLASTPELPSTVGQNFNHDLKQYLSNQNRCGNPESWEILANVNPREYMTSLPAGLILNPVTGIISGTPSQQIRGKILVSARNRNGKATLTVNFNITSTEKAPCFTVSSTPPQRGTLNQKFTDLDLKQYLQNNGTCGQPSRWMLSGGTFPRGIDIHPQTGVISGTPTEIGTKDAIIKAENSATPPAYIRVSFDIQQAPSTNPAPCFNNKGTSLSLNFNQPTSPIDLSSFNECGRATSWQVLREIAPGQFIPATLPAGLDIHPVTGIFSGTAFQITSGPQNYIVRACNPSGCSDLLLKLNVLPSGVLKPCIIKNDPLEGFVGRSLIQNLSDYFGNSAQCSLPTRYRNASSFDLPKGLTLEPSGLIHGTPTESTSRPIIYSIEASNAAGTTTLPLTIIIHPPLPCLTKNNDVKELTAGVSYTINLNDYVRKDTTQCGLPERWERDPESDELPRGLTLNNFTGLITGIPSSETFRGVSFYAINKAGRVKFTLIFDVRPNTQRQPPPPQVQTNLPPKLKPISPITARKNQPLVTAVQLEKDSGQVYLGGWALSGSFPPGLTPQFNPTPSFIGTPTTPGNYSVNVTAYGPGGSSTITIRWTITD